MSFNQNQNQNQNQVGSSGSSGVDLGFHSLVLDFTPLPFHPPFPLDELPTVLTSGWKFDDKLWDAGLLAVIGLREFAQLPWTAIDFPPTLPERDEYLGWYVGPGRFDFIAAELEKLRIMMENERDRYLPEIIAQADTALPYWFALLGITPGSKPKTIRLLMLALRIGEMAGMFWKHHYLRVRPSVLCPGLQPPFGPPRHPSFPSNHSLQSWLVSLCLDSVTPQNSVHGSFYRPQLWWLAARVAVNRERAGLHYPSDSKAGCYLAEELFKRTLNTVEFPTFLNALAAARLEW